MLLFLKKIEQLPRLFVSSEFINISSIYIIADIFI